ncbi:hypothetical protein BHF71_00950 [Vulcanibacillus modesticaldus]|uniref:Cell envelope-related transcriptional attenuator domain-containing protein n=1 Tax=Vulcanibacillus modesticaldus TaxID=337097 RepID=A0A1D2YVW6_9BACI|nr:LCP family protein [Vulcanibacillus modesticaldus]OEF99775.1 hypothetical protein BHF71_00950 [Vulcanibacillus modesticaldus]
MDSQNKQRLERVLKSFLIVILAIMTVFAVVVVYLWNTLDNSYQEVERIPNNNEKNVVSNVDKNVLEEPLSILLLGVDGNRTEVGRTDTIMLMVLNPKDKSITEVSLPRDTYTEIVGKGYKDKVNHSMQYGIPTVIATVENFFNIPIDYYVTIDFKGFEKVIDTIGGIEINVDKRMKYTDVAGNLYIDLQPGLQVLNGEQALGYARFRHDKLGDLGRIERQKKVIKAVLDKTLDIRTTKYIFELMNIVGDHLKTDIPKADMIKILTTYRDATSNNLSSLKVNGESKRFGELNLWYYVVSDQERARLHDLLSEKLSKGQGE